MIYYGTVKAAKPLNHSGQDYSPSIAVNIIHELQ